ncbi:MAG: hypothetical protein H6Q05_1513 [Acidobacteria bacterium]|nr:hypothetical protein [Acidobacteriota bacterium]
MMCRMLGLGLQSLLVSIRFHLSNVILRWNAIPPAGTLLLQQGFETGERLVG